MTYWLVMLGGALGSAARHWVGTKFLGAASAGMPWGTLCVNLLGSLALGVLTAVLDARGGGGDGARLFLGVGVLGGFTTYSTFNQQTLALFAEGGVARAGAYVAMTLVGGLVLGVTGVALVRLLS